MKYLTRMTLLSTCLFFTFVAPAIAISPATSHGSAVHQSPSQALPSGTIFGIALLVLSILGVHLAVMAFSIARYFRHSLAYDLADDWHNPRYLRHLPNVLHSLATNNFHSPWPLRCNPWSMHAFERRLLRAIRPILKKSAAAEFVTQHLSAWIWLESHHSTLQHFVQVQRRIHALKRLTETDNPQERSTALAFLNSLDQPQLQIPPASSIRVQLQDIQRLHTLMREHGYSISPEFDALDQLDQVSLTPMPKMLIHPTYRQG